MTKSVKNRYSDAGSPTKKEDILQKMINGTRNIHLVYLDRDFNFVLVNQAYAETCGYKPKEMIGKNHFALYPDEENEAIFRRVRDSGVPASFHDKPFVFPDQPDRGVTHWDWTLEPIKDGGGVTGLVFSLVETTTRKRAEKALAKSEEEYRSLFENMTNGFAYCRMIFDKDGKPADFVCLQINDAFEIITGLNRQHVIGKKVTEAIPGIEKSNPEVFEIYGRVAQTCQKERFEIFIKPLKLCLSVSVYCPRMGYFVAIFEDITERKKAEEELKKSEERFVLALKNTPVVLGTLNLDLHFTWVYNLQSGYRPESVIGKPFGSGMNFENMEEILARLNKVVKEGTPSRFEVRGTGPAGERVFDFYIEAKRKENGEIEGASFTALNITDRKKAEEAIKVSEKKYRRLFETSQDGIIARDLVGRMIDCNQAYSRMIGYSKKELKMLSAPDLLPEKWLEQREKIVKEVLEKGGSVVFEREYQRKDGFIFPASVRSWRLTSENGKIIGVWSVVRDISQQKELQNKLLQYNVQLEQLVEERTKQLKDSERLAAIGATAGMVGHDIRNPLQAMTSDVYLAKSDLNSMPEGIAKEGIRESLDSIEKNVDYVNKIVMDLQDFARPLAPAAKETDIEMIFDDVLIKKAIPENIEVSCKVDADAKKLIVDPNILTRILANLVNNAVQAMSTGGKLAICAYRGENDLILTVQDTGAGIPEDIKPKLFAPLFTTKSKGQGFGLAVVKRMTEALGGTVSFESEKGNGTKFILRFPQRAKR